MEGVYAGDTCRGVTGGGCLGDVTMMLRRGPKSVSPPSMALLFVLHRFSTITHRHRGFSVKGGRPGVMGGSHPTYHPLLIPNDRTPVTLLWGFPTPFDWPSPKLLIRRLNQTQTIRLVPQTISPFYSILSRGTKSVSISISLMDG